MAQNKVVEALLATIEREVAILKERRDVKPEEYERDPAMQHVVERAFQNAIQSCIDIGARLIAQNAWRRGEDYHDIVAVLLENGVLSSELAPKMREMVGFRNALVHCYRAMRHDEVHRHLRTSLVVIEQFARAIVTFYI